MQKENEQKEKECIPLRAYSKLDHDQYDGFIVGEILDNIYQYCIDNLDDTQMIDAIRICIENEIQDANRDQVLRTHEYERDR